MACVTNCVKYQTEMVGKVDTSPFLIFMGHPVTYCNIE